MHDTRRCITYFMGGLGALLVVTPAVFVCRRKTSKSNKSARTRPVYTRCRGAAADFRSNVYSVEVLPSLIPPSPHPHLQKNVSTAAATQRSSRV